MSVSVDLVRSQLLRCVDASQYNGASLIRTLVIKKLNVIRNTNSNLEPGQLSRYSDWLLSGFPRGQSSSPDMGKIYSPRLPDRLWAPPNLLSNGYWGYSGQSVNLYVDALYFLSFILKNYKLTVIQ
jgi:hypothetical protein